MINIPTVLVLGAGASMPYGFPSGDELRKRICKEATGDAPSRLKNVLKDEFAIPLRDIRTFGDAFLRSRIHTIDEFLGRNSQFSEIGKLSIAYCLCNCENPDAIRNLDNDDDWYGALWNVVQRDAHKLQDLRRNQVKFITFNYDRSLEFFLHDATRSTFQIDDAEALSEWSKIEICHVYGLLGNFHFLPEPNAIQYKMALSRQHLSTAAKGIVIMPDARNDSEQFSQARKWLDWADRICFLGFGFDSLNLARLGIENILRHRKDEERGVPSIYATVLGKTAREIQTIRAGFGAIYIRDWRPIDARNLMLLRASPILASP